MLMPVFISVPIQLPLSRGTTLWGLHLTLVS
uniref:Uncharacterized protein n=1 Tax=Rhizophora mucronata TaxID=61149 RepID=A0A2P2R0X6_RHIMU